MFQLVYISSTVGVPNTREVMDVSCRNNARDGLTGLLYFDGKRFLQALEGERAMVERTYARIVADPRHRAPVVLSSGEVPVREFGAWTMAERRPGADGDAFVAQVGALVANASPAVRATFDGFVQVRRAA
ncbi:MAG: BLUF domain-containing protein [Sphingomonas adhaesiva]|uniref:BLUF domain-containing protein n=1 Tax=Sphingomonas adhaesiva TaxID=28212 RepID=UPI002FF7EF2D